MAKWGDILTDTEKTELKRLMDIGIISDTNINQFADRFLSAPNRETAFQQALDTSTGAAIGRDWHGIRRGFADPRIGVEAFKEHYAEKGVVGGTADIAWSAITTPVRSWAEILGGEPGLGENPLETLVGAASVVPVGSAAAGVTSASLRGLAKAALRSGNFSRATQLMKAANRAGRVTQSRVWRPTAQAIEVGDIVTGIEEWPLELIGEGVLEAGSALGGQTFNRLRSQESIIDSIVNTAREIQTDAAIEEKIHESTQIIGEPVLQRIMAENEDVEDIESARDLLELNAMLRYVEQETTQTEDTNAEATAEAEAHDAQTGSQTTPPRPWHELHEETAAAERALQDATARAAAAEAEAVAAAEGPLAADTERATEHAAETERAAHAAAVEADREGFGAFRNEYLELYDALTGGDTVRTRDMMYADFANAVNPTEALEEGIFGEETEGINVNEESVAVARQRAHQRLRELLGDTLYERYYGQGTAQRPSVDDRVRAADELTDELVEGEETDTDVTEAAREGGQQVQGDELPPSSEQETQETEETEEATGTSEPLPEGEQADTQETQADTDTATGTGTQTQDPGETGEAAAEETQPLPEDTEGRAELDAAREDMPEVVGNEDVIRWQRRDGTWEETPVVYKLIERAAAIASHRFTENQVSLEHNPTYNWALGIQGRKDARLEEVQDRLRPDEFNANLLLERTQGMTRGTPTLLPSYDAVAGNHRLMLLELMYQRAGSANSQAQQYVEALTRMLPSVGIDPAAVEQINEPILVRQVIGEVSDVKDFAEASNREDAAPRTTEHQALEDAEALTTRILELFNFGEIGGSNRRTIAQQLAVPSRQNLQALTLFVDALPPPARARYRRGNTTQLAAEAKTLFENAVLAKTFIDTERGRMLFAEMTDATLTPDHAARAMLMMLPHLAKFDAFLQSYNPDVQALSISADVAAAVQYLSSLRSQPNNLTIGQVGAHLDTPTMMEADATLTPEAHALMKAIYASQSANQIANIVINTVGQLIENIRASGVSVSTQITIAPIEYGGPSKLETLNAVIEEAKTPETRDTDDTGQQEMEGMEDEATDTGGTPAEPAGDGDPTGDADRTGDVAPDSGSTRVGARRDADGRDRTPDADGESASTQDDEPDRGDQPGERTPGTDTPGTGAPPVGDTEPTGEDTDGATEEPQEPARGHQPLSAAERAAQRMRARRGLGPAPTSAQETQTPTPEDTPAEPQQMSAAERAAQRMRARRGLDKSKAKLRPDQQELYDEFLGDLAAEYAADLQAQGNLDEFFTELLDALTAEPRTGEQQALYDEFLGDLAAEYIADLQAMENRDDFYNELLETLQTATEGLPEEAPAPESAPEEDTTPEPESDTAPDTIESVPDSVPIAETHVSPLHEPTALASQNHPDVSDIELNLSDTARGVVSAAQELAVKLMKRSSEMFTSVEAQAEWMQGLSYRLGFLLGDGTGSGKTITGLTFILDQIAAGNKQHFIIGPKQDLFYNNYTADMKKLGGPTRNMFNFGELKPTTSKKKGAGIGFSTYANLVKSMPNLVTGRIGLRLSQFLHNMTGKRPPLEILNPEAHTTIQFLKRIGRGSFPTFEVLNAQYQEQNADDQKATFAALPKPLQQMLNVPKRYTAKKYAEVLKIFKAFDTYDTKYKTASVGEFIEAAATFEGVILFDEAHSMRGDTSTTRDVGLLIQRVAPNARVVYLSATPITKVEEIRYAERLGLWGEGAAFDTYADFEKAFAGDDLTAKEVIAKDLKGYGRYLRRSLDMSGVSWENREHALTDEEVETYDLYVQMLQAIKAFLRAAADRQTHLEPGRGSPRGQLIGDTMKQFYNRQQEFFNQLQTAFKTQALLPEIINQLKAGNKVAVQLSKTGETAQQRAEQRAGEGATPDLSLKNLLIDFLMSESSPIYKRVPKGTGKSIDYDTDANGNKIIHSEQSRQARDNLIEELQKLPDLPGLPIDMLHATVREAGFDTAEITGRSHYYVDGKRVQNPKNTESLERQFRETRDLNFIIISDAGGEGRNLQTMRADSLLVDYDIETGWNVVNTIQKFGRFKRTGAAHDPIYILTQTDSPASKRIAGALALKLTDMGALATGQARSQMNLRDAQQQAETEDADNYILGSYGKAAMGSLWANFHAMQDAPYIRTLMQEMGYTDAQGEPRFEEDANGNLKRESIPDPEQYLSRLFGVRYQKQAEYAELFFTQLDALLAAATEQGTLDQGTTQLKARNAQIVRRHPLTVHPDSGTTTDVVEVTGEQTLQRNSWEVVEGIRNKQPGYEGLAGPFSRYVRNTKSGKIYALFVTMQQGGEAQTTARGVTNYKRFGVRGRPDYINSTQLQSGNWETLYDLSTPEEERSAKLAEVQHLWEEAGQTAEATRPLSRVMITGMLLPIWDKISVRLSDFKATTTDQIMEMLRAAGFRSLEELQRSMQIRQLLLADGTPIQGRIIPVQFLESLFNRFGIDVMDTPFADLVDSDTVEAVAMDDVMESVSENKAFLTLDNGAIVSQVGDMLEIYGFFTEEDVTALGLTPVGEIVRGNELIYNPETPHSTRYNIQETELARWELPIEKLPDLLQRIPPDTMTARGDDARPLNIEGIVKPDAADPHPDPSDRISRYRQFIKLRQLILPYAENIGDNNNWERGHIGQHRAVSYLYYLDDVDKYVVLEFSQSSYGTNMTFSIEGETHDRLGSVQMSMPVPEGVYSGRARGIPRFASDILNGNTEHLDTHTYLDNAVIQNMRMHRVRRELQKETNKNFKPSTDLEFVDVSEFSNTAAQMKVGTLPDGQAITMVAGTIKRSRTSAQWIVALRIGDGPLKVEGVRQHTDLPKYFAYVLSAKDVDAAMDNMVRKLRGDTDIMKGLSSMFSESTALEGVLNAYDKHQQELEAERENEHQRAQEESEQSAAPRISRSGEVPGESETQYALDQEAIASLETDVEKIVATIGDTSIRRRILSIHAKIMNGHPVNLVGQQVNSAHEVAILAQAFRNPLIEVYRTLYIKDGKIVAHDGYTLNSSQTTRVAVKQVRDRIKEHDADGIYMLHNHPTSFAMLSNTDISADHSARAVFGNKYLGEIVVNSGTYAKLIYNEDGTWDHQDMIPLTPEDVGWDTTSASDRHGILADDPLYKGFTPEAIARFAAMYPTLNAHRAFVPPGISTQDPEYQNLLNSEEAPKAIAALGNYLKTREGWTVIVGMSNTGYITLMTEFQGLIEMAEAGKLQQFLYENMDTLGADLFHILTTGGEPVRRTLMNALGNSNNPTGLVNGVASLWVDGESVGTVVPLPRIPSIPSPDIKEGRETEYVTQPPPPEEIVDETPDETPAATETQLKTAIAETIETGEFTDDGNTLEVEVEGVGTVKISVIETPSEATELSISPPEGGTFYVDIPPEIGEAFLDGTLAIEEAVMETLTADIKTSESEAETPDTEAAEDPDAEEEARRAAQEDMGEEWMEDDDEYWEKGKADPTAAPDPADTNAVISVMPNPDDFDQETRDNTEVQRALNTFTDAESGIRQILGLSTRQGSRLTRKTFSSGFGVLEEMSKTDRDGADKIGDVVRKNILRRQFIAKSQFARDATRLLPILKELEGYVNARATPTLTSRGNPQARAKRGAIRQRVNDSVWRYIEDNKTIKDPQLLEVAKKLKDAWREMLIEGTHTMLDLTRELKGVLKEDVFITDSAGNRVPWYPESFDGFIWDAETRDFKRNEGTAKNPNWVHVSIEEAHRKAERLYTPHYFKHNRLRSELRKLQQLIDTMNALLKADNPAADKNRLRTVGIVEAPQGFGGYIFEPDGTIKVDLSEMLAYAAEYWTQKELSMRGLLEYTDAGLRAERYGQVAPAGAVDGEARIGYYGHLERARETDDKFYERDVRLLMETRRLMWDRVGEIATIGQVHPILGTSPRLEAVLEQVRAFRKNKREFALGAVAVALKAGDPKSMFERMPQFGLSVEQGLSVQQDWRVYTEDDTGNRVRTDEYQEIDIAKMNLTDEVLETLRTIGFITTNAEGVDVVAGETIEDRHLTMARFFYEFYNTIAQREASVKDLYLSLGHWHTRDPLEVDEAKFWQKISDITTATTLSWTTALQNLLEVPLLTELTGTRTMLQGLTKIFAKESRDQLRALAEGLSHAPRFMAETDLAEKYLGSWVSGFTRTDKISRAIGLGVGLENAKKLITEYVNGDAKTKTRLRRVFDETALDTKLIESLERSGLDNLLQDVQELIMSGQVTPKFGDTATSKEKLAWTVLQHMHYISDTTFKAYDATSLPPFLMKQTPLIRLFMKYKSWMFQHNAFKMKNWRRAVREARTGNFRPLWNMAQSAAWSGVTYSMLLGIYAAASGYDDEDNTFVKGMHAAQTFGMSSVLLEMASRADSNWWQLSRDMMGQAAGPVGSITSQTVAPMITGDWNVAGSQVVRRIPVVNVFKRLGGFRLLEENEE